jgi:hypothetical protein
MNTFGQTNKKVAFFLAVTALIVAVIQLRIEREKPPFKVISNDVISYYAYLPAAFIYHDVSLKFLDVNPHKFGDKIWADTLQNGNYLIRTSMGMSIMYSPFFFVAHAYTSLTGGIADGYSKPYWIAILASSLVYLLLGMYFLQLFLSKYFSNNIALLTTGLIFYATNLFEFSTLDAAMSHGYSFSITSIILYVTHQWYSQKRIRWAVYLGLLAGLLTLIRPTNILIAPFLLLFNLSSLAEVKARFRFFIERYFHLVVISGLAFIVWIPQFLYWKMISGSFLINSYGESGGSFFFNNPQIFNQLFSYRKGLLVYTPIIALAFTGIILSWKTHRSFFTALLVFTVVYIFVTSSWWAWWFAGGLGCRGYIEAFPVFAIGLAIFIQWISQKRIWIKIASGLLILFMVFLNLFQSYQYFKGYIHFNAMTKEAYWISFLNLKPGWDYYYSLISPNYEDAKKGIYYTNDKPTVVKQSKEKTDELTKKKRLDQIVNYINSSPTWMKQVEEKARLKKISVDSMIHLDALFMYNKELNENKIQ